MEMTRMSERDEIFIRDIENECDATFSGGEMRLASKADPAQYICFLPYFKPDSGEIDLAPETAADVIERGLEHSVELFTECARRILMRREAMAASAQ